MIGWMMHRMYIVGLLISMVLSINAAAAADFCKNIDHLIDEATRDFSGIIIYSGQGSSSTDVMLELKGASDCAIRQLLEGKSYYCTWTFQYRDVEAYATFETLGQELKNCLGDRAALSDDQQVNHPDFYDAQLFLLDQAKLALSVKDKSALGNTFVFISVQPHV